MKIVICGAGIVGSAIARHLAAEQNDVTVIDLILTKFSGLQKLLMLVLLQVLHHTQICWRKLVWLMLSC